MRWFVNKSEVKRWELSITKIMAMFFGISHLLAVLFWPQPNIIFIIIGLLLFLFGELLFLSTVYLFKDSPPAIAFSNTIITDLKTEGPYKFVRHPIYTSYLLAWIGGTIGSGCWPLILSAIVMYFIYRRAANEEEAQWLNSKDHTAYITYQRNTGMFFPKLF
ncbi:MAG: isoprenylcysteine carboxylmethyltransferase family protein [Chitinophagales bacterium]